ncbi:activating signal cointegrator 1 complex subunit 1 isoform X2 [Cephus cinctus]|uniref:Activating signal cointegrator 1 complex subunit 1 isoform X2 n=1 Tax=Cephus cinctus TaxID=211228 RepID=A0AAJ7C2P4_CEPCN|nr:activating signal cointegrator 1 complex subunit 1 isoform X2 [Cephus cinctus]
MDVTEPKIVFVEGRRYRVFESEAWSKDRGRSTPYFPFIIGVKHATRKKFESDTATSISIPKLGYDGNIVIRGRSRRGIISARRRIDLLIESSTKSLPVTHFLSIPMFGDSIRQNFNAFKEDVLRNSKTNAVGVDEDIFQRPHLLHLTLVCLILLDEKEHKQAIETFNACETEIVRPFLRENGPISIKLQGVECMNDDPSDVNVLYTKIQTKDDNLNKLVDEIYEYFYQTGLTRREYKTIKLHMTIMNSAFKFKGETQPSYKKRKSFDATEIIKAHKDTYFGEVNLESIHLSQRGTSTEDHYYRASAEMNLKDCY